MYSIRRTQALPFCRNTLPGCVLPKNDARSARRQTIVCTALQALRLREPTAQSTLVNLADLLLIADAAATIGTPPPVRRPISRPMFGPELWHSVLRSALSSREGDRTLKGVRPSRSLSLRSPSLSLCSLPLSAVASSRRRAAATAALRYLRQSVRIVRSTSDLVSTDCMSWKALGGPEAAQAQEPAASSKQPAASTLAVAQSQIAY